MNDPQTSLYRFLNRRQFLRYAAATGLLATLDGLPPTVKGRISRGNMRMSPTDITGYTYTYLVNGLAPGTTGPACSSPAMTAPAPELRERPLRTMVDMGMDMGLMEGMAGMDGMKMPAGAEDHAGYAAPMSGNTSVAWVQRNRLGEPGTGLERVGHRVLVYTDLRRLADDFDARPPDRERGKPLRRGARAEPASRLIESLRRGIFFRRTGSLKFPPAQVLGLELEVKAGRRLLRRFLDRPGSRPPRLAAAGIRGGKALQALQILHQQPRAGGASFDEPLGQGLALLRRSLSELEFQLLQNAVEFGQLVMQALPQIAGRRAGGHRQNTAAGVPEHLAVAGLEPLQQRGRRGRPSLGG